MPLNDRIFKLRTAVKMTREQFAEEFGVSRQTILKWENGTSYPELSKLIDISRRFDISLDSLILDRNMRMIEEFKGNYGKKTISPNYSNMHFWESYSSAIIDEYRQSVDEGLDIEEYKDIFFDISKLPQGAIKKKFGDVIFEIITEAKKRENYKYNEPSTLEEIKALSKPYNIGKKIDTDRLESKINGAWVGRVCGCMLGKSVEGIHTDELIPLLKNSGNYPMHRYILKSDIDAVDASKFKYDLINRPYADTIDGMPPDDDTNYTVLAQQIIDDYGFDFTPLNVLRGLGKISTERSLLYCGARGILQFYKRL